MCGCVYLWLRVSWSLVSMCGCVLVTHCLVCVGVFSCGSEYHGLQFHFVSVCVDQPRAASRQFIWRQWWLNQLSNMRDSVWSYPLVYLTHWVLLAQAIHSSIWRTACTWHRQFTRLFDALGALGTSNLLFYLTHWVLLAQAIHSSIWRTGCSWHKQFTCLFDALGALGTSNLLVYLTHWVHLAQAIHSSIWRTGCSWCDSG